MGLNITPLKRDDDNSVGFAYSGFNEFRTALAKAVGIDLDTMVGFGGETAWPDVKDEPLVYLLNHSDCDGALGWEACAALAPRLREVLPLALPPDPEPAEPGTLTAPWYQERGRRLADLCDAVERGDYEELLFS